MKLNRNGLSDLAYLCNTEFLRNLQKYCSKAYLYGDCITSVLTCRKFNDIDLVLDTDKKEPINWLLSKYTVNENKFGGMRFNDGHFNYDVWYLNESVNLVDYGFEIKVENLLKSCLFSNQSVYYDISRGYLRHSTSWETFVLKGLLDYITLNTYDLSLFKKKALQIRDRYNCNFSIRLQKVLEKVK